MKRIVHLSDLHFGRDRPELVTPLLERVNALAPDLVAISGDMTQRARPAQFRAARAFIDRLEPPVLCVPGNHDVPLYNLFVRWVLPWRRYRRWIDAELEPVRRIGDLLVVGLNTVDPYSWQRGRIGRRTLERLRARFTGAERPGRRIVVAHHPVEHRPTDTKKLTRGAARAIAHLSECGADVVLTGHLHSWRADTFATRAGQRDVVQVHAGTGLSTRMRGEENDFNLLELQGDRLTVTRYAAGETGAFAEIAARAFRITAEGWRAE